MRQGQQNNKRMRGRGRKMPNNLNRVYESNGPDVKIRGTANHIAEKYQALSRDAHASSDPVAAENYLQHAEHYLRIIAATQVQQSPQQPFQSENNDDEDNEQPRMNGASHSADAQSSASDEADDRPEPAASNGEQSDEQPSAAQPRQRAAQDEGGRPPRGPRRRRRGPADRDTQPASSGDAAASAEHAPRRGGSEAAETVPAGEAQTERPATAAQPVLEDAGDTAA